MTASSAVGREALMGNKDKGGRSNKKAAAKGLKEKRLDKKAKRAANSRTSNDSMNKTFGH